LPDAFRSRLHQALQRVAADDALGQRACFGEKFCEALRAAVPDRDAMALFGDIEGEVRAHRAQSDQSDLGFFHACASLLDLGLRSGRMMASGCGCVNLRPAGTLGSAFERLEPAP